MFVELVTKCLMTAKSKKCTWFDQNTEPRKLRNHGEVFQIKNLMEMIPHSKELVESSRITPKQTWLDNIWQSY